MKRPTIEVADIVRRMGKQFLERLQGRSQAINS